MPHGTEVVSGNKYETGILGELEHPYHMVIKQCHIPRLITNLQNYTDKSIAPETDNQSLSNKDKGIQIII